MKPMQWTLRVGWVSLVLGLSCPSVSALAYDQLYQSQCDELVEQLQLNEQRQRQGYTIRQGEAMSKSQQALQQLLDDACQHPILDQIDAQQRFIGVTRDNLRSLKAPPVRPKKGTSRQSALAVHRNLDSKQPKERNQKPRRRAISNPPKPEPASQFSANFPVMQVSTVALSAPYNGTMLMAWLGYYREPQQCFGIRELSKIVQCTEARLQARQRFEQWWRGKPARE